MITLSPQHGVARLTEGSVITWARAKKLASTGLTLSVCKKRSAFWQNPLIPGTFSVLAAIPLALLVSAANSSWPAQPEKAVLVVAILFAALLAVPCGLYLLLKRRSASPAKLTLMVLGLVGVLLIAVFFYRVSFPLLLRADFLIWTESDFVNDILKIRAEYPLYSAQQHNDSFVYPPGSQVVTYGLAWLSGNPLSVPVYRIIQLGFAFLAAIMALLCCRTLLRAKCPGIDAQLNFPWGVLWLPLFFLIATNSLTNPFVSNLNSDSLSLLLSVLAFYILLKHHLTGDDRLLVVMAVFPALGFLFKQSIAIWAVLFFLHLAVFHRPFSLKLLATYSLMTLGAFALVWGTGYLIWGELFVYWLFIVLGEHGVSVLRSFQNSLEAWPYFAIGLLGGLALLRGNGAGQMLGPWVVWLTLMLVTAYTSGIAWMLNHMGPASLMAGIWFVAGLTYFWVHDLPRLALPSHLQRWLAYGICAAIVVLLYSGLGLVRVPVAPFSPGDAERYISEIERQFQGESAEDILLDVGSWVYIRDGVIMKDRAPTIGERGYSATGDFSGILRRIREQRYAKILVRGFHSPDFWYDHDLWPEPSGIRQALQDHYQEVGAIRGVEGSDNYLLGDIIILVPQAGQASATPSR